MIVGLFLGLALCVAIYYPGLHGPFIFDDAPNIVQNRLLHVDTVSLEGLRQAAFSSDSGTLKRPLSMLSFWLDYYISGLDPFSFKLTNLLIHLINGLGIFWLTRSLLRASKLRSFAGLTETDRNYFALAASVIWLIHPLNLTSVLYVVQRMTSLSATFVILGLICYVNGREQLVRGRSGFPLILFGVFFLGALALFSKENGALLPLYIAVTEVALFQFADLAPIARKKLKALVFLAVAVPIAVALSFLATHPHWLEAGYRARDFTLSERLMTEARALWLYLQWLVVPRPSSLGLFHDDVVTSRGLLDPGTTLLAILGIIGTCAAAIRFRKTAPLLAFATWWYLAGNILESSFIGLELVHEHRAYLPMYGPLLAGVCLIIRGVTKYGTTIRIAVPAAFVVFLAATTAGRALDWLSMGTLASALVRHHPASARANYVAGTTLGAPVLHDSAAAPQYYDEIKLYFTRSTSLDPTSVNGLFDLILLNATNARPIDYPALGQLRSRLSTIPLNVTVIGAFRALVNWTTERTVTLPSSAVADLFQAAIGNHSGTRTIRATLLSLLSSYYFNVAHDHQEAVSLALAATEEDPSDPANHLSLADLAFKLGNFALAAQELDVVTLNDRFGRFTLRVRKLDQALSRVRSKS